MSKANKIAALALVLMALGVVGVILMVRSSSTTSATLFVDNGLDRAVQVALDGQSPVQVGAHAAVEVSVPVGPHQATAVDDKGTEVERLSFEIPSAQGITERSWVYNVKGKNSYKVYEVSYGEAETKEPYPIGQGSPVYELPNGAAWFLPVQGAPDKGRAGTIVRLVGHSPVHPADPCCKNLKALAEKPGS